MGERVDRLCRGLRELGVGDGDRVATFAWNSQHHLEAYLAAPCMGAVLHTLNIRLFPEQLVYVVNHAEDKVILVDGSLVDALAQHVDKFETVEHYVVMGEGDLSKLPNAISYEELLERQEPGFDYPEIDDRAAAGLCYTSGTTGNPKGVLYSHRSNILHTMGQCLADAIGVSRADRILPVVPMFHANAWGLPYAACMAGASLIMPNRFLQAEPLARLIEGEKVTAGRRGADDLARRAALVRRAQARPLEHADGGVRRRGRPAARSCRRSRSATAMRIIQAWGMTETSPLALGRAPAGGRRGRGALGLPLDRGAAHAARAGAARRRRRRGGRRGTASRPASCRCAARGSRAPTTRTRTPARSSTTAGCAPATSPRSTTRGYIRISDRSKDVIKSGGEWISSVDLENELMGHDAIAEAAVIAKPDERWSERPLACVVLEEGQEASPAELQEHLASRVAKWWIPDEFAFIDEVPKTSVGKFDKKVLRKRLEEGEPGDRQRIRTGVPIGMSRASWTIFQFGTRTQPWDGRPGISPGWSCRGCRSRRRRASR